MLNEIGRRAKEAEKILACADSSVKDKALIKISEMLIEKGEDILIANRKDIRTARINKMPESLVDRLALDESRIRAMAKGAADIAAMNDPVGKVIGGKCAA